MSHAGRLLVATPLIADPNFERAVVLLVAHDADGAFGVVLNRPSETPVAEVAPDWSPLAAAPGVVFIGGPVSREAVLGLGRCPDADPDAGALVGDCAPVDLHDPPPIDAPWTSVRLFAGSAGWAPGQLEDELAEGAWWPVDAEPDDVVGDDVDGLWGRVLRRQPGELAWHSTRPHDPNLN